MMEQRFELPIKLAATRRDEVSRAVYRGPQAGAGFARIGVVKPPVKWKILVSRRAATPPATQSLQPLHENPVAALRLASITRVTQDYACPPQFAQQRR